MDGGRPRLWHNLISAQAYVAHHTVQSSRAVGMSGFLGAVFAAFVCGPAIGGFWADRLGYEQTLLVAAGLALFSAGAALVTVDPGAGRGAGPRLPQQETFEPATGADSWCSAISSC